MVVCGFWYSPLDCIDLVLPGSAGLVIVLGFIFVGVTLWSDLLESPIFDVSAVRLPFFSTTVHSSKIGSDSLFGSVHSFIAPPKLPCLGLST